MVFLNNVIVKQRITTLPNFIQSIIGQQFWKKLFRLLLILNALIILVSVSVLTIDKQFTSKFVDGLLTRAQFTSIFNWYPSVIALRLKSTFTPVEHVYLDIKHKHIQALDYQRESALKGKRDFNYVPATITNSIGEHSKVKIRLKGDRVTHWEHFETSSYRIRIKGDNAFYGMKAFSFQKPRARNYIHEWIFLEMMREEGLVTPRYKFIHLHVNGKNLGPYVIEEHYTKHLLEANQMREGPILRIDENSPSFAKDFLVKEIIPYNKKKWMAEDKRIVTTKAIHLLEAFRQGKITVSEAFDARKLATFFAIADVTGGQHGVAAKSIRFYFNPITSKLEPIPFDGHPDLQLAAGKFLSSDFGNTKRGRNWVSSIHGNWMHRIFNDPEKFDSEFIQHYIDALYRVSDRKFMDDFFSTVDSEMNANLAIIYTEIPLQDKSKYYGPAPFIFDKSYYYNRQSFIRKRLSKVKATVYVEENDQYVTLRIRNSSTALPIEFLSLQCSGKDIEPQSGKAIALPETASDGTAILHKISLLKPSNFNLDDCKKVNYRVIGEKGKRETEPTIISFNNADRAKFDLARSKDNLKEHPFLEIKGKTIIIPPGTHQLNKTLVTPKTYTLSAGLDTTIILNNGAMIYSKGPINFVGSKQQKVSISSHDGTGQGITVINAAESRLEHVEFSNMTSPNINDWSLTGVLNFYESPVQLLNTVIRNTASEDAINIVRSSFTIDGLEIHTTKSDAIDIDFGEGKITNARIIDAGNDAIDISGTQLFIKDIYIENAKDKGISAGELSEIDGENVEIRNSEIGIASKDSSLVSLSNIKITGATISLTAYNKKPEYENGTISLINYHADEREKMLIERRSKLIIDGKRQVGTETNIEKKLYGNIYGKSSK